MKLTNPTDAQICAVFRTHICKWKFIKTELYAGGFVDEKKKFVCYAHEAPNPVLSADAVIPWLEKWPYGFEIERAYSDRYAIRVMAGKYTGGATRPVFWAEDKTLPRAAVIALLRAHGVQIEIPQ